MTFSTVQLVQLLLIVGNSARLVYGVTCPTGQTLHNERCYKTYRPSPSCEHDFTFDEANQFCEDNGGTLASVHSQEDADFITALIKADQKAKQKACSCATEAQTCACANANQDHMYWIGMQLTHAANQSVNGASWTDGSVVNYGNPTSESFRPPFVPGRPVGSADDGRDDSEVCPGGNQNKCVQVYGYGEAVGRWRDQVCNNNHTIQQNCCNQTSVNGSAVVPSKKHRHHHHSSSSSSDSSEDVKVNECRDRNALNGLICKYCPAGWTHFQNHCYMTLVGGRSTGQFHADCIALGANVASIHSTAENQFVANLATNEAPSAISNLIGLQLGYNSNLFNAPVISASWSDGSAVNYGNPTAPGFVRGTYPWAPNQQYPAQPDNRPPPGNCVLQWLPNPGAPNEPGSTWDDANCPQLTAGASVCKL